MPYNLRDDIQKYNEVSPQSFSINPRLTESWSRSLRVRTLAWLKNTRKPRSERWQLTVRALTLSKRGRNSEGKRVTTCYTTVATHSCARGAIVWLTSLKVSRTRPNWRFQRLLKPSTRVRLSSKYLMSLHQRHLKRALSLRTFPHFKKCPKPLWITLLRVISSLRALR